MPARVHSQLSHINKLELLQSKILRIVVNAPWYIRNEDICKDLIIPTVKEEKYKERMATNPNQLAVDASKTLRKRRLKRKHLTDLTNEIK